MKSSFKFFSFWLLIVLGTATVVFNSCGKDDESEKDPNTTDKGIVINGVKWATRNVGAPGTFVDNPEDVGMFYQWNRPVGWSATNPMISSNGETIWDSSTPTGTTWEMANNVCPAGYRMPTAAEIQSLIDSSSQSTIRNGVYGRVFGSGDNTIFLPVTGFRDIGGGTLRYVDGSALSYGFYWSSTPEESSLAYYLYFNGDEVVRSYDSRCYGRSIRCVAE